MIYTYALCHVTPNRRRRFDRFVLRSTRYSVPFAVTRATLSRAIQYYIVHHVRKPSTASIQTVLDILRHLDSVG